MSPTPLVACSFSRSNSALAAGLVVALGLGCKKPSEPAAVTPEPSPITTATPPSDAAVAGLDAARPVAAIDAAVDAAPTRPDDLVNIHDLDDGMALDIRYATTNNFAKRKVYPSATCKLRRDIAERVVRANKALAPRGMALKLWDCYRPFHVQEHFWKLVPDGRYVARPVRSKGKPAKGSKHNRGAAIDVTLVDEAGTELDLPTDYDDFSKRAHRGAKSWSAAQRKNVEALTSALTAEGFTTIATEWWHFDGPSWRDYALADEPL